MKLLPSLQALPLLTLALAGCGNPTPVTSTELRSDHARIASPAAAPQDVQALVDGNTRFALDLHRAAALPGENVIFAPFSVSIALGMTWAGARTDTESQMAEALHFTLPQERHHAAFNALDQDLTRRASQAATEGSPRPFRLRVSNTLWGQQGYGFLPSFLDALAENYGAGVRVVDFAADAAGARRQINALVGEQTEQRIPELLPEGVVTDNTAMVLTNAVYFNAGWARTFDSQRTQTEDFHTAAGGTVAAALMHQQARLPYAQGDGWQAVELPYQGLTTSMLVLLPAEGQLAAFEQSLSAETLASIAGSLSDHIVTLALPRFSARSAVRLSDALQGMGMTAAFAAGQADFSGIDGTRRLFLTHVIHEGFISVDESGTEAAGATAVIAEPVSLPPPATFRADRPFLYAIRDRTSGTVLFFGRVADPTR